MRGGGTTEREGGLEAVAMAPGQAGMASSRPRPTVHQKQLLPPLA